MRRPLAVALVAAALAAASPRAADVLPAAGPVSSHTAKRLLLVDGAAAGPRLVAVGDRGYVLLSDDQGATWRRAKAPPVPLLTAVHFLDDKRGWAVGHDAAILATADAGETWTLQFSAAKEQRPLLDVAFLDARRGFAVGAYGAFYETSDGGAAWSARKIIEDDKHLNAILDLGKGQLLVVGESGTILRSADSGATWNAVPAPYKGSFFGAAAAKDGAIVAFGLRGRIFRSADGGSTWTQVNAGTEASLMGATLLEDGALVIAGNAGVLLVSRDNGRTFTPLPSGRRGVLSKALPAKGGALLLLGEGMGELAAGARRP